MIDFILNNNILSFTIGFISPLILGSPIIIIEICKYFDS